VKGRFDILETTQDQLIKEREAKNKPSQFKHEKEVNRMLKKAEINAGARPTRAQQLRAFLKPKEKVDKQSPKTSPPSGYKR